MYLHIGASVVIPEQDVLGIFDLDNTTSSRITRNFLAQAQQAGQVIPVGEDLPKSFLLCRDKGGTPNPDTITTMSDYATRVLDQVRAKNANEPEFLQAVQEVISTITPVLEAHKKYEDNCILERITEPERTIIFRVPWTDDQGKIHVNRGYRVEFNSAIGPYKTAFFFNLLGV